MAESSAFRCYYEDGTVITNSECPLVNQHGSPLINSEFTIIEDVQSTAILPWFFLIMFGILLLSDKKKGS